MQAAVGDQLHVHGNIVGHPERTGEIVEVRGAGGEPPHLVRFDDGHTGLVFPGACPGCGAALSPVPDVVEDMVVKAIGDRGAGGSGASSPWRRRRPSALPAGRGRRELSIMGSRTLQVQTEARGAVPETSRELP